jgi:hypothetical protein
MSLPPELFPEAISLKQIVFVMMTIGFLAVAIPATLKYPWMERVCVAGIMFMSINPVDVTFFSYTFYRGDIRGIEFGVTDWFTITLIVTMLNAPRWKKRRLYTRNANEIPMALYLGWCMISVFVAVVPQFAFFGVTRLLRAYALFWVAYNWIRSEDDLRFIIWCVVGITFYSFYGVLMDKYVRGTFPPRGSFPHQNSLVTFQNIMNFIIFAMVLGDTARVFDKRTMIYWAALGAGSLTSVATLSRGGMATMVMGYFIIIPITFFLKQGARKASKKIKALVVMGLASLPALAVVLPEIIKRFETAPKESEEAREYFNEVAHQMGQDYPMGIGLNNYSFGGAYMEYKDALPAPDQGGLAHHIYWLHFAELGPVGVVLFVSLMLGFMVPLVWFILKRKDGLERLFAVGVLLSFVIAMLIGKLEWNFRQTQLSLIYFMFGGFALSLQRVERERIRGVSRRKQMMLMMAYYAQKLAQKPRARGRTGSPAARAPSREKPPARRPGR